MGTQYIDGDFYKPTRQSGWCRGDFDGYTVRILWNIDRDGNRQSVGPFDYKVTVSRSSGVVHIAITDPQVLIGASAGVDSRSVSIAQFEFYHRLAVGYPDLPLAE